MRWCGRGVASIGVGFMFAIPAGAVAVADVVQERNDEMRTVTNTCSNERVTVRGTSHLVIKKNKDGTSTWQFQLHSEGVGNRGNRYVLNVVRKSDFDASGGFEIRVDSQEVLVSKGSAPNQKVRFHYDSTGEFDLQSICTG